MTTTKPATPLPWKHGQLDKRLCMKGCEHLHGVFHESNNKRGDTVQEILAENCEPETAAYIVHACNAYPELVAALRSAIEEADGCHDDEHGTPSPNLDRERALLAKLGEDDGATFTAKP